MKLSLALASLGLCIAPAFAEPIGWMILTSDEETWAETPESQKCIENWEEKVPLNEIYIKGNVTGATMECFVYNDSEKNCTGPSTALEEGLHKFPGDLYASSFLCVSS
ncbi:hypothetical protein ASPSYDRAFT_51987 [Aspergillus sydowii CBS 593.65]|uniref:Uncharacterized protein n=1 Tax=Aspergillus sydowii CBS 593.65 TaxID=1036612 RepID=A0A1L9SYU2_9EURO|nr:uncharacterized protein ASPSYDRAFT_51987 [Aspergillus sydowii CBS 593.65]OJJ52345.1 hypothetical protein ASPSYDRAFT_51987 [Aspergillus sydowii CBS 593.65]